MNYGFGILGTGTVASFHARAIETLSGGNFIGVYSRTPEKTEEFSKRHHGKAYSSYAEMLANPAVHVITICTPSALHGEHAIRAIEAGKHVLIEKPMEVTVAGCDRIIAAAKKYNVVVASIFQNRFIRGAQLIKDALDQERFGRLVFGDAYVKWFRSKDYYADRQASGTLALDGGGALMNQAIHAVDMLQWFMGPVQSVFAYADTLGHDNLKVEDTSVAVLRFANGAMGTIEASTSVYPGFFKTLEISGTRGAATLEEESLVNWAFKEETIDDDIIREEFQELGESGGGVSDPAAIDNQLHTAQFQNFIDHLNGEDDLAIDAKEGRKAVEIVEAIYFSVKTGHSVSINPS
ncbi:Gfo/Idh/MocA family oxidoreductase [Sansalvadorimonas sp. 2012CJ34-2]|uniref:Gfo/Idh/MocA family oxidoreductase n=1 Tax=Parendozoicomonas callyspongiae TaxID=2942213 RepID=A0ABT0PGB7_9GAMM|nr:Gfo/Idh/MocA family oxidoreductase [Sansalvadorimonas sp. 2012CJ34-2]MCL6270422.1 Gfo/Idh/MocA family oxidoreductase [Sansalvadorimonas sp. 2012CJ34-2]